MKFANLAACVLALSLAWASVGHAQSPEEPVRPQLTFLSHRSGHNVLYRAELDGSNPQPVLGGRIDDVPSFDDRYVMFCEPHWTRQSPNGKYFASWVYEIGRPYEAYQGVIRAMLRVGDLQGTWTRLVSPDCNEEFTWSPDSRQVAFTVSSDDDYQGKLQDVGVSTQVVVMGVDGSNELCVLEREGEWFALDWSPDGNRLLILQRERGKRLQDGKSTLFEFRLSDALASRAQLEQYDPDWEIQTTPEFLDPIDCDLDGLRISTARYSPTRNEVALLAWDPEDMYAPNLAMEDQSRRGSGMRLLAKAYVLDLDANAARKIADAEEGLRGPICWSPSGDEVLVTRHLPADDDREQMPEAHGLAIWAVGRDGANERFITTGWSPDCPRLPSAE